MGNDLDTERLKAQSEKEEEEEEGGHCLHRDSRCGGARPIFIYTAGFTAASRASRVARGATSFQARVPAVPSSALPPPPRQPPTLEERTQQLRNINKTFATFAVVQTQRNLLAQPPGGLEQHSEDGLCAHFPYSWLLGLHRGVFEHITRPGRVRGVGGGGGCCVAFPYGKHADS